MSEIPIIKVWTYLLEKNLRFAVYRVPENSEVYTVIDEGTSSSNKEKYFVIHPFQESSKIKEQRIINDIELKGDKVSETDFERIKKINPQISVLNDAQSSLSFLSYEKLIADLKQNKFNHDLRKVVISNPRAPISFSKNLLPYLFYEMLKEKNAFVYMLNTVETGLWMGMTPEKLLVSTGKKMQTVALAGTKANNNDCSESWSEKNVLEHNYVVDYIKCCFDSQNIKNWNHSETKEVKAGSVKHLQTDFEADNLEEINLLEFAKKIHPTPAVAGVPKKDSIDLIKKHESYNRAYYTGFLGVVNSKLDLNLYVNLRCLQFTSDGIQVFAGGGVVFESDAYEEWQEMEQKAQVLEQKIMQVKKKLQRNFKRKCC